MGVLSKRGGLNAGKVVTIIAEKERQRERDRKEGMRRLHDSNLKGREGLASRGQDGDKLLIIK